MLCDKLLLTLQRINRIVMRCKCLLTAFLILFGYLAIAQPVTITPPSANIEPGESVTLTATGAMYYVWSPAQGLSTTDGPVTVASPTVTTTYTCEGYAPGDESVVNGNFALGNTGFTSAYQYNSNLWNEGTYYVDADASLHHENFHGFGHDDNGNFMMVNGATTPRTNVWTQEITVLPDKWYAFSTWACTLAGGASEVARLQFSINNVQIGEVFSAPSQTMVWQQFYELWYSGTSTTATITILNQNTGGDGNDFGLDDISFRELVLVGNPQCTVTVGSMSATASIDDDELCEGASTTLHALPTGGSDNYSYTWTPANTLDNPSAQHPIATPALGNTTYTCTVTDNSWGGSQNVSVSVNVYPNYMVEYNETICSGDSYDFFGEEVSQPDSYPHHGTTQHGCDSLVILHLSNYPPNEVIVKEISICEGQSYNFHGDWYDQDGQVAWFDTVDMHGCLQQEKLVLTVGPYQIPEVQYQYECYSHNTTPSWTWDKTGVTYHADAIDEILLPDPNGGCDILYRLDLRFHEEFYQEDSVVSCDVYTWPINGQTYVNSQQVVKTFYSDFGNTWCDSTYVLNLEISTYETHSFRIDTCDFYHWDSKGMTFISSDSYVPSDEMYRIPGDYTRTFKNQNGCDSLVTLHLGLDYAPHPTDLYPVDDTNEAPHWVVTATEFQFNAYEFYLYDSFHPAEQIWDSVRWRFVKRVNDGWVADPSIEWILDPFTDTQPEALRCKMYVLNYVEDTVWLEARVFNDCDLNGAPRYYWFVCSFYGMDEQQEREARVYPNPSQGTIFIEADDIRRVRVLDMLGQVVADFGYHRENSVTINLNDLPSSVYLLEIKTDYGSHQQRIVLER